jgi:AGZA family xanthine/uracil permease-like MFS transporter
MVVVAGIESAAGISEGGRTGATGLTVSALFLLSVFFAPLLGKIPPEVTLRYST